MTGLEGSGKQSPQRIELRNLFNPVEWQDKIAWQPYQDGVDIFRLYGDGVEGPTSALIRFRKEARIPAHTHAGYEHILVLTGSQRDQNALTEAGTLVINPPGTSHSVWSEGCIVLAIYEKPVSFLKPLPPVSEGWKMNLTQ